jgi:hypothetical protein
MTASSSAPAIMARYEVGQAHRDGSALVLGRDLEESVANIARFWILGSRATHAPRNDSGGPT